MFVDTAAEIEKLLLRVGLDPGRRKYRHHVCPSCGAGTPSSCRLEWRPDRGGHGTLKCWACRRSWNPAELLAFLDTGGTDGKAVMDARRKLGLLRDDSAPRRRAGRRPGRTATPPRHEERRPLPAEELPPAEWQERAEALMRQARDGLDCAEAVAMLRKRGLSVAEARRLGLGWVRRPVEWAWGGRRQKVPAGLLICVRRRAGILRLRVRSRDWAEGRAWPVKYCALLGGASGPWIWARPATEPKPVVLVEAELDAALLSAEFPDAAAYVALGGVSASLTAPAWQLLRDAPGILLALDADDAGRDCAAAFCRALPRAVDWPPVRVKPGGGPADMSRDDRAAWLRAGLMRLSALYGHEEPTPPAAVPSLDAHGGHEEPDAPSCADTMRPDATPPDGPDMDAADALDILPADDAALLRIVAAAVARSWAEPDKRSGAGRVVSVPRRAGGWMPVRARHDAEAAGLCLTRPLRPADEDEAVALAPVLYLLRAVHGAVPVLRDGRVALEAAGEEPIPPGLLEWLGPAPEPDIPAALLAVRGVPALADALQALEAVR